MVVTPLNDKRSVADEIGKIRAIVRQVSDPEIPILSIEDLGILRDVSLVNDKVTVVITPTYVGCPAMDTIAEDIKTALGKKAYKNVEIQTSLSPAVALASLATRDQSGATARTRGGGSPKGREVTMRVSYSE